MYRMGEDGRGIPYVQTRVARPRRQDFEPIYQRNGAIYLVRTRYFRSSGRLRGDDPLIYEMPWERSINIDTPGDFVIAKALIESGLVGP
jgi:CMP-N-acetylneuraminic acid synthetase